MNDGPKSEENTEEVAGEVAMSDRLQELKKARNDVLGTIPAAVGGGEETSVKEGAVNMTDTAAVQGILQSGADSKKEVSASTIGRMMGLVTTSEFRLAEGKIDLLTTRVNALVLKLDKIISILEASPTGSDLDRIDVQIGALKNLLKESILKPNSAAAEQSSERVSNARILSNNE